ncbi:TetR/AcrR family transcriptional regulator [Burkholderiales bacterium]|jgi:AcrR family transcriptional regulator|nr:helix-turn-helix transcriptional regulator [Betaproteobacteria bacterium]MDC3409184.1 TetR/AcrR family transcriptional regulator [Burkholderiales bacterium]
MNVRVKARGRPKKIDRDAVIRIALSLYWEHGVENVSMSRIAREAETKRVSLYDEFGGEGGLIQECLNLYKETFKMPLLNGIDESADLPSVLKILFHGLIYDGNLNWDEITFTITDSEGEIIPRPKFSKGCFYLRTKFADNKLSDSHRDYIHLYDSELERRLTLCIETAKGSGKAYKHLDSKKTSEFINSQMALMQSMRSSKTAEEKMLNIYEFIVSMVIPEEHRI